MSCNITAGISTGCNDQVGGIVGIHYFTWTSNLVVEKDANGVITRVWRGTPFSNISWQFIDCSNATGSVTETYNVNSNGSILGFHQSAQFFMPTTANPLGSSLYDFIQDIAIQNNLVIGIETGDNAPLRGYSKKCFVFGLERPAYCVGGSKETGITYNDNNGYTIELGADSKEPMQEIAYMAMHSWNLRFEKQLPSPGSTDASWTDGNFFNLEPLVRYEGGNIRNLFGTDEVYPEIYVQPGETLTISGYIGIDWSANAFSGTTFLPEWEIGSTGVPLTYDTSVFPLPTAPGFAAVYIKGAYTNNSGNIEGLVPVKMVTPTGVDISGGADMPTFFCHTITRTT